MRGTRTRLWVTTLIVSAVALGGCKRGPAWPAEPWITQKAAYAQSAAAQSSGPAPHIELPDFAELVHARGSAVVNVTVVQAPVIVRGPGAPADPFYDFFRRFGIPLPLEEPPGTPMRGMGSGVIVSPNGYILTNAHVLSDATEVTVKLIDRREFSAKVIGIDARSDLAVSGLLGLSVRPLTSEERETAQTRGSLVVTGASGAAALAGVQPGDIVLAVNGNPVKTIAELRAGIKGGGRAVALLIQRGETQIFIPVPTAGSP